MKKYLGIAVIALASSAPSFMAEAENTQNFKIEVGQFDRLRVLDNVNVVYRCNPDSTGYVQFRGGKEFANAFIATPKKGELKIQVSTEDVNKEKLPTLYVYSDFLISVENSSNFTVAVENPAPCAEFQAKQIGNGNIVVEGVKANVVNATIATGKGTVTLSGQCRDAELRMLGTGIIMADRLVAGNVVCKILGSGSIGCAPVDKLNVSGIGSTKVYYSGEPLIKKSGGGKLLPLPESGMPKE